MHPRQAGAPYRFPLTESPHTAHCSDDVDGDEDIDDVDTDDDEDDGRGSRYEDVSIIDRAEIKNKVEENGEACRRTNK